MFEMTRKDFETKLQDIFTDEQIERLNEYGYESAKDALEHTDDKDYLYNVGRWTVCEMLACMDPDDIRKIIPDFTDEQVGWLYDQIEKEW